MQPLLWRFPAGVSALRPDFPIENIPAGLRWISNFIWGRTTWKPCATRSCRAAGWPAVWFKVLAIAIIGAIFYGWDGAA